MPNRKALIFCDYFFTKETFEDVVKGNPFWNDIERKYIQTDWPKEAYKSNDELQEFNEYPENALKEVEDCEIIINHMAGIDEKLLKSPKKLKIIGSIRSAPVNINLDYTSNKDIPVVSAPQRSVKAVAEYTVGLIICARRNIIDGHNSLQKGEWKQTHYFLNEVAPPPISKQKIGLIGLGNIAKEIVRLLKPFNCQILVYDPFVEKEVMDKLGVKKVELDNLLSESDLISLHVRYTKETEEMIGEEEFKKMKDSAIFINTARGEIVEENALYNALKNKSIKSAVLDAYQNEPLPEDSKLLDLNNVITTPHIGGASISTAYDGSAVVVEEIEKYFK